MSPIDLEPRRRWRTAGRRARCAFLAAAGATLASGCGAGAVGAKEPLVRFHASSGFATQSHLLVVRRDGRGTARLGDRPHRHAQLPDAAVEQLRRLLQRAHLEDLEDYYGPPAASDAPTYDVTFDGRTVRTESGSPPAPKRLWRLVFELDEVFDEVQRPFVARVTVTGTNYLRLTVRKDRTAVVETDSGTDTPKLSKSCLAKVRAAVSDLDTTALSIGLAPRSAQNGPPMFEVTRSFESFHTRLDRPHAAVKRLLRLARAIARDRCDNG